MAPTAVSPVGTNGLTPMRLPNGTSTISNSSSRRTSNPRGSRRRRAESTMPVSASVGVPIPVEVELTSLLSGDSKPGSRHTTATTAELSTITPRSRHSRESGPPLVWSCADRARRSAPAAIPLARGSEEAAPHDQRGRVGRRAAVVAQRGRGAPPDATSHGCSLTGNSPRPLEVGLWEPYDGRLSRTVLREPGGEIPPGYSPDSGSCSTRESNGTLRPPLESGAVNHGSSRRARLLV